MHTEYGVLLAAAIVAPAANEHAATDQAAALGRPLCRRQPGRDWVVIPARLTTSWAPRWPPTEGCAQPGHGTLRRHERTGEIPCGRCRVWRRHYARGLTGRAA